MSHKSWVTSKIVGPLYPAVAQQAAEVICQLLVQQGAATVASDAAVNRVKGYQRERALLGVMQIPGQSYSALGLFLSEEGQLEFFEYEGRFRGENGLIAQVEALWGQVYTACAIATALQAQGKQVEVQPTAQGELQVVGISA